MADKTLVVLSKHVFAEYLPVIIILAAKQPDLLNTPKRPVNGWTNHWLCLRVPSSQGPVTECMDIQANPGLTQTSSVMDLRSSAPVSERVALCNL